VTAACVCNISNINHTIGNEGLSQGPRCGVCVCVGGEGGGFKVNSMYVHKQHVSHMFQPFSSADFHGLANTDMY
jgi:hypothetical protein